MSFLAPGSNPSWGARGDNRKECHHHHNRNSKESKPSSKQSFSFHLGKWKERNSDTNVLNMVSGCEVKFTDLPRQQFESRPLSFTVEETVMIVMV